MVVYSHARQKASFWGWSHSAFCLPGPVPWHGLIDFLLDKVLPNQVICTGQKLPQGVPLSWLQIQTSCIWLSRGIAAKHFRSLTFCSWFEKGISSLFSLCFFKMFLFSFTMTPRKESFWILWSYNRVPRALTMNYFALLGQDDTHWNNY